MLVVIVMVVMVVIVIALPRLDTALVYNMVRYLYLRIYCENNLL